MKSKIDIYAFVKTRQKIDKVRPQIYRGMNRELPELIAIFRNGPARDQAAFFELEVAVRKAVDASGNVIAL